MLFEPLTPQVLGRRTRGLKLGARASGRAITPRGSPHLAQRRPRLRFGKLPCLGRLTRGPDHLRGGLDPIGANFLPPTHWAWGFGRRRCLHQSVLPTTTLLEPRLTGSCHCRRWLVLSTSGRRLAIHPKPSLRILDLLLLNLLANLHLLVLGFQMVALDLQVLQRTPRHHCNSLCCQSLCAGA